MRFLRSIAAVSSVAVFAAAAPATVFTFNLNMSGTQEVPAADLDGTGVGTVTIDNVTNVVTWQINYSNIGAPGLMHIHVGASGVNGGIVVNMGVATTGGAGTLNNSTTTTATNVTNILNNPTGYYVNIHNSQFGAGAIRGQLIPAPPPCPADFNHDGTVDGADLGALLGVWGTGDDTCDLNNDGTVDGADLGGLLGEWGPC